MFVCQSVDGEHGGRGRRLIDFLGLGDIVGGVVGMRFEG